LLRLVCQQYALGRARARAQADDGACPSRDAACRVARSADRASKPVWRCVMPSD